MVKKLAAVALGATLIVAATGGIAGAQDKCAGAKEKATGKLAGGILKCDGKGASKMLDITGCPAASDPKLDAAFAKAESKGGCNTSGDAGNIKTQTHSFASGLVTALWTDQPAADKCAGSKLGAAGKKASGLLGCHAKAAAKGLSLDPACVTKVEGKFSAAFAKAEAKGGCQTTGDANSVETTVNNYVNSIVNALQPPATTTTSTTHTTTTSTTTTSTTTTTTATTLCNCCPGAGSLIKFTNGVGAGTCGDVRDDTGAVLFTLNCGGLYTGAGASTLSNPAAPPDMGTEYVKTASCVGNTYTILPTVVADLGGVGGNHRNCTSAGVADPDYPACVGGTNAGKPCVSNSDCPSGTCTGTMPGCLFGSPLAIPNPSFTGASVCVVNRVQTSASGSGNCSTGSTNLNLPLASDLYLTGDLLDGSAGDRPNVAGINPCPICTGPMGSETCKGGPRNSLPCHPDTSVLSAAYPTSHDCPPPPGPGGSNYIGALPIPFNLSTGNQTSIANTTNLSGQEVFCGFCGVAAGPTFRNPPLGCANDAACSTVRCCNGGTNIGLTCTVNTDCPSSTCGTCGRCKQRDSGAFNLGPAPGTEHTISITGSSAGQCLANGGTHAATLVSVFCIPPAYNSTVDANGDLPGPGVVSLPGLSQLIP